MQHATVLAAGHQFADPGMLMIYLARRFQQHTEREVLYEPDMCSLLKLSTTKYHLTVKAPFHALLHEEESYRALLTQPADAVIYFQSVREELLHLMKRDFTIVSQILAGLPKALPVFTLFNDSYCGSEHGHLLSDEELNRYAIPESRMFRTAIGYRPNSGDCSIGADEVFDELLAVCGLT